MLLYTARYVETDEGWMGQLVEWPEVVTEGASIGECRDMLRDALREMVLAYKELGKELPPGNGLIEAMPVDVENVRPTA